MTLDYSSQGQKAKEKIDKLRSFLSLHLKQTTFVLIIVNLESVSFFLFFFSNKAGQT